MQAASKRRAVQRAAFASIIGGSLICGIKFYAYYVTGSSAIFSDAIESINNILAAVFSAYAVWQSARAPDLASHPFGRGRLEYFSAGFEGGLIALAGLIILYHSAPRILGDHEVRELSAGMFLTLATSVLNGGLGWYLVRNGRRFQSEALIADGKHVLTDVYSSLAVVVGLIAVQLTGWRVLDPIVAVLMAVWILWSGGRILSSSFDRLMDRVRPETLQHAIDALRSERRPPMILPHRLRIRESGLRLEVDFHLIAPRYFTIEELARFETELYRDLSQRVDRPLDLLVHFDPCRPVHCRHCPMADCPVRSESQSDCLIWDERIFLSEEHIVPEIVRGEPSAPGQADDVS